MRGRSGAVGGRTLSAEAMALGLSDRQSGGGRRVGSGHDAAREMAWGHLAEASWAPTQYSVLQSYWRWVHLFKHFMEAISC